MGTVECPFAGIRSCIMDFALEMEKKLRKHDDKDEWEGLYEEMLLGWLKNETKELAKALEKYYLKDTGATKRRVIKEAADVANYAMMIADNVKNS